MQPRAPLFDRFWRKRRSRYHSKDTTTFELFDQCCQFLLRELLKISFDSLQPRLRARRHGQLGEQAACDISAEVEGQFSCLTKHFVTLHGELTARPIEERCCFPFRLSAPRFGCFLLFCRSRLERRLT